MPDFFGFNDVDGVTLGLEVLGGTREDFCRTGAWTIVISAEDEG